MIKDGVNTRAAAVIAVMLAVIAFSYCILPELMVPDVSRARANELKNHMTKGEVRAILGGAPHNTTEIEERWIGREGCLRLIYDQQGRLVWREWDSSPFRKRFPESIFDPIQWPID